MMMDQYEPMDSEVTNHSQESGHECIKGFAPKVGATEIAKIRLAWSFDPQMEHKCIMMYVDESWSKLPSFSLHNMDRTKLGLGR